MFLKKNICRILAAVMCVAAAISCTPKEPETPENTVFELQIPKIALDAPAGSQFIYVTADGDWQLSCSADWASTDRTSGSGTVKGITLSWTKNDSGEMRSCDVVLSGSGKNSTLTLVQLAGSSTAPVTTVLKSDPVPDWLELPAMNASDGCYYYNHSMTVGNRQVRNYSFYLDPKALVSRWVAYPLNKTLAGSGSRTDRWGLDPKVPRQYQPVIYSAFRGGYDRGHQLPSADRLAYESNISTFYGTNMTPQRGDLNQNAWATLESMVRDWSSAFDTLYVVTGADVKGSTQTAMDNDGKNVCVPVGYFKALLGYKKSAGPGISSTTGGFTGIAFYFEHRSYTNTPSAVMNQSMTIDALESRLGYDFFPGLPAKIGETYANKVESTKDSWWK